MKSWIAVSLLWWGLAGAAASAEERGASIRSGKHVSAPPAVGSKKSSPPSERDRSRIRKVQPAEIKAKESHKIRGMLDLNSATADELRQLPGVGPRYAKKIIDHRPYARKDELVRKKIISQEVYGNIRPYVAASED